MTNNVGIDYFGSKLPFAELHNQSTLKMRRRIYDFFDRAIGGVAGKKILDHGSTPETKRLASNCFIRWLLEDRARVWATSPEAIDHLEGVFPGLTVLDWSNYATNLDVDYIISSAVIEHVGRQQSQIEYVSHLLKLCPRLLITTPNRYHWLEFHTKIPLLHWLPRRWHRGILRSLGMKFWSKEENLRLLSPSEFSDIVKKAARANGQNVNLNWYRPRFLGMVSNLCILVTSGE